MAHLWRVFLKIVGQGVKNAITPIKMVSYVSHKGRGTPPGQMGHAAALEYQLSNNFYAQLLRECSDIF